jgi:hypothetical protein
MGRSLLVVVLLVWRIEVLKRRDLRVGILSRSQRFQYTAHHRSWIRRCLGSLQTRLVVWCIGYPVRGIAKGLDDGIEGEARLAVSRCNPKRVWRLSGLRL